MKIPTLTPFVDSSTLFTVEATTDTLQQSGIHNGDQVLVDTSKQPQGNDICVVKHDGQLYLKRKHRPVMALYYADDDRQNIISPMNNNPEVKEIGTVMHILKPIDHDKYIECQLAKGS